MTLLSTARIWAALVVVSPNVLAFAALAPESYNPLGYLPACCITEVEYPCDEDDPDALCNQGGSTAGAIN